MCPCRYRSVGCYKLDSPQEVRQKLRHPRITVRMAIDIRPKKQPMIRSAGSQLRCRTRGNMPDQRDANRSAVHIGLYQSSLRVTDDCPIAVGNGHDLPRLIGESVPGVAAVVDDVVEGFEDAVRKP